MRKRPTVLSALVLLSIVAVVLVAYFVPGEQVTRLLAVVGILLGIGKTAYDIWDKERERRKKAAENQERVSVGVVTHWVHFSPFVAVDVYNDGSVPVHIRRVRLVVKDANGKEDVSELVTKGLYEIGRTAKLGHKDRAVFYADGRPQSSQLMGIAPENISLTVESYSGVLATISGGQIQEWIKGELNRSTEARERARAEGEAMLKRIKR